MKTIKIQSGRGAWNHQPSAGMGWLHRRIWERISGPFFSFGLHALALVVILFCIPISRFGLEDDAIEVVMLENNPVELELDEPVLDQEMMTEEDFSDMDWVLPSPDAPPPPEIMDFNDPFAIDVADSPLILSGVMLVDQSLSAGQLARAGGSRFGFDDFVRGDLVGTMYDLKRNRAGQPRTVHFEEDLRRLVEERFSRQALGAFYRVPKQLYLTHLLQPYISAAQGPEAFGVGDLMEPRQWIIHYTGQFQSLMGTRYRFAGDFDDVLLVFVDGRLVLEAGWGEPITSWRPSENVGQHMSYTTHALAYGDWFDMAPLSPARIDIVIGENPGGWMGGVLLVEQEGRTYAREENGRPVLPVFAVQPLTEEEQDALNNLNGFQIAERIPVMGVRQDAPDWKEAAKTAEVKVTIN